MKNKRVAIGGFTLVEMMIAISVFVLVVPTITMILMYLTRGFTAYEAASQLKNLNQSSLSKIYLKLTTCKRIFQNDASGNAYMARINTSDIPVIMGGAQLPSINEDGTLDPGTTNFVASTVGNVLFFGSNDATQVMENVSDGTANHTISIDIYRFMYYYLTTVNPKGINGKQSYRLVEYQSVKYADYNQLFSISNATLRTNTVTALYNNGINLCWNPSATNVNVAFSSLTVTGGINASSGHLIQKDKYTELTKLITGIMGVGYRYGVSQVSSGWTSAPKTVPLFAAQNVFFPGGFEVVVTGHSGGRKILIRQVLVAQVGPTIYGDDRTILCSARDLW